MKELHFLILGSLGKGAIEHIFIRNFRKFDIKISSFDIQTPLSDKINESFVNRVINKIIPFHFFKDINKIVLSFAKEIKPDLIFVFKGQELFPETIKELKSLTRLIVNYNPDHPLVYLSAGSGNKNVYNSLKLYDIYFTYSSNILKKLKEKKISNSYCIPFGFDDEINPDGLFDNHNSQDFVFLGSFDKERAKMLSQIEVDNFKIFGPDKWKKFGRLNNRIATLYQGKALYDSDYHAANRYSLGSVNLLREHNLIEQSHNMRTFEIPGVGGLLISNRTKEHSEFFLEDSEAIYFDSTDELNDKLKFLSKNMGMVEKIKNNAFERCLKSNYSFHKRISNIVDVIHHHLK